jgi:hypothetical protein
MRVVFADGEETVRADNLLYLPLGHTVVVQHDVAHVAFSPPAAYDVFLAAAQRNVATGTTEAPLGQCVDERWQDDLDLIEKNGADKRGVVTPRHDMLALPQIW